MVSVVNQINVPPQQQASFSAKSVLQLVFFVRRKSRKPQCKLASGSVSYSILFHCHFEFQRGKSTNLKACWIQRFRRAAGSSFRELARIAGTTISVSLAVGPISCLLTWQMYFATETRSAWDNSIHVSSSPLLELKFWYCNIDCFNGYSTRPPLATHIVVFSDAGDIAFGGFSACSRRHRC